MPTIAFEGASDDLCEISADAPCIIGENGGPSDSDEFDCCAHYNERVGAHFLFAVCTPDGTEKLWVWATYGVRGVWRFAADHIDEEWPWPEEVTVRTVGSHETAHSTRMEVSVPDGWTVKRKELE